MITRRWPLVATLGYTPTHPPLTKQASAWEPSKQLASAYVVPEISVFLIRKMGELEVSPLLAAPSFFVV